MPDTHLRHTVLLRLIPREPRSCTTTELHSLVEREGYTVTKRSIERNLLQLERDYGFRCETRGKANHWFWPADAKVDIHGLDPASALVLCMAQDALHGLLPHAALDLLKPYFENATRVLAAQPGNLLANWRNKVQVIRRGPALGVPKINEAVARVVYDALLTGRQLKLHYAARGGQRAKETILHPQGLVLRDGLFYLVATAWDYTDPYHYALHRMSKAGLLEDPARPAGQVRLTEYLENTQAFSYPTGLGLIKLRLAVDTATAAHLAERPLGKDQVLKQVLEGHHRVSATVTDSAELRWWILGLGSAVEVLGPPELRTAIRQEVQNMGARYGR